MFCGFGVSRTRMFSGIVESVQPVLKIHELQNAVRVWIARPQDFNDIRHGDSIAVNGICLTVEEFDEQQMQFTMAAETLKVLGFHADLKVALEQLKKQNFNLERSLKFGDRIHGHLVTGHVEGLGQVTRAESAGDSFFLNILLPESLNPYVWKKGSITANGVSLTINEVVAHGKRSEVHLCLIPETLKRTNLKSYHVGNLLTVEPDYMARAVQRAVELGELGRSYDDKFKSQ